MTDCRLSDLAWQWKRTGASHLDGLLAALCLLVLFLTSLPHVRRRFFKVSQPYACVPL